MKTKKIIYTLICMVILLSSSVTGSKIFIDLHNEKSSINNQIQAELPVWNIGDEWVFSIEIQGSQGDLLSFDLNIEFIKMKVIEIENDIYTLSLNVPRGSFLGSGFVDLDLLQLQGALINTKLDGFLQIKQSTLEIIDGTYTIDGYIDKVVDIPFTIDGNLSFYDEYYNQTNFSTIRFPISIGQEWTNQLSYIVMAMNVNLISETSYIFTYVPEQTFQCQEIDVIQFNNNDYDAFLISRNNAQSDKIWYSIAKGNILKLEFNDLTLGNDYEISSMNMNLLSTTYEIDSSSPNKPDTPTGPININVGETVEYQTQTNDPDNDYIRYIFDWNDGTESYTDFHISGETITILKQWMSKGTYNLKVKARDIYGKESSWSDELEVTVLNEAPEKPQKPNGPVEGKKDQTYQYTTSSTDPDNHKIRYGWDWNGDNNVDEWTDYANSGEEILSSHQWNTDGQYEIKVKAQDEYNEESDWSDPLSITIAKNKEFNLNILLTYLLRFNQRLNHIIELIKK